MELHGRHQIAGVPSAEGEPSYGGVDPCTGADLSPRYANATAAEVDRAVRAADAVFDDYRSRSPEQIARFLQAIGAEVEALGSPLLERCHQETALPARRLLSERTRTVEQAELFAAVVREGSWVDARIDIGKGDPSSPPHADLRRMLIPMGPVGVFGASNFPLAISVVGNDTIAALAAGCPVIVKAHPGHPGTCEMLGHALAEAARKSDMPPGVFSLLHGASNEVGQSLVRHPLLRAVGFTGSLAGGRALFDAAAARPNPIPVFAEMGSVNPVFLLPGALGERGETIASGLVEAMTRGVGQFCTNPGMVLGMEGNALDRFLERVRDHVRAAAPETMLHAGIHRSFLAGIQKLVATEEVMVSSQAEQKPAAGQAVPTLLETGAARVLADAALREEVFGPSSVVVRCGSPEEMEEVAEGLEGSLTGTLFGTAEDLAKHSRLASILERRVGRLLFNGFPPGMDVGHATHHGGPYPATLDGRSTSIGTASILRFARPICYQGFPDGSLPEPLRNANVRGLWRLVNGRRTREDIG